MSAPARIRLLALIDPAKPGGEIWRRPAEAFGHPFDVVQLTTASQVPPVADGTDQAPCAVLVTGDRVTEGYQVAATQPAVSQLFLIDPPSPAPPLERPAGDMSFTVTVISSGVANVADLAGPTGWAAWGVGGFELRMVTAPAGAHEGFVAVRRHVIDSLQVWWLDVPPAEIGAGP